MILAAWAAFRALPRGWHYLAAAIAALGLLWALWAYLAHREEADDRNNQAIGAERQRAENMAETIDRVEQANEARDDIRSSDHARYDQCVRTARTPANCERFLPSGETPVR